MQLFYDFFPLIAFFAAYKFYGIYAATAVIIVAVLVQTAIQWARTRTVSKMHLVTAALVLVFGGLTLALRDGIFIQWKPTIVNWLFTAALLASQFVGSKPLIQRAMEPLLAQHSEGEAPTLEAAVWRSLNAAWALFFAVVGAINLVVVYSFSEEIWVNFKVFGVLGLTLLFVLLSTSWLIRKMPQTQPETEDA